jgi:TRAP-type mannitol/chloroaromatic compound transport system substrate-binding protein
MAQIIDHRTAIDQTVRLFDSFYAFNLVVNGNEFDIVYGYFKSVCKTVNIAANFTSVFFRVSQETGIPALELLGAIQNGTTLQMNQVLAYYLNSFKSKTTLYGVSVVPQPNQPVARNIVQ